MEPFRDSRELLRIVSGELPPLPCSNTMQLQMLYAEKGIARGIWTVDERFLNGAGVAMGGFVTSVADITMAFAVASVLEEGETHASIDIHTTFHRPVQIGTVHIEARVERKGNNTAYLTCEASQNDKKVASATSSVFLKKKP